MRISDWSSDVCSSDLYIAKPFSQRLVIARIRAILRRVELNRNAPSEDDEPVAEPITRGRLQMDPARHKVAWDGKDVTLTVTEFLILETLAARPGIVRSRNQLMDAAYQDDVYIDDRTIDSHIKRLDRKSTRLTSHPKYESRLPYSD